MGPVIFSQRRADLLAVPDECWRGAMDDDAGLRAWIAELAAQRTTVGKPLALH